MPCANVSVAIALAGGFAMLIAASGTPLNVHDQTQTIRTQAKGTQSCNMITADKHFLQQQRLQQMLYP